MNSGCEGGFDRDNVQTWTNPLLRLYYIDAKSLFWFLFLEIPHLKSELSLKHSAGDIVSLGHDTKQDIEKQSKGNTLHLEVC